VNLLAYRLRPLPGAVLTGLPIVLLAAAWWLAPRLGESGVIRLLQLAAVLLGLMAAFTVSRDVDAPEPVLAAAPHPYWRTPALRVLLWFIAAGTVVGLIGAVIDARVLEPLRSTPRCGLRVPISRSSPGSRSLFQFAGDRSSAARRHSSVSSHSRSRRDCGATGLCVSSTRWSCLAGSRRGRGSCSPGQLVSLRACSTCALVGYRAGTFLPGGTTPKPRGAQSARRRAHLDHQAECDCLERRWLIPNLRSTFRIGAT
jgi:hypothetical protein